MRDNLRYQLFRAKNAKTGKAYPKWRIRYLEGRSTLFSETGYTDKGTTEIRAKQRLKELEKERHDKAMGVITTSTEPITDLVDRYLLLKAAKGGKQRMPLAQKHLEQSRAKLDYWIETLKLKTLQDIHRGDVEVAQAKIPFTPQTRDLYVQHLKAFTRWCVRNEILIRDPLAMISKHAPTPTFKRRALTLSEIERLLAVTSDRRALIYKLALLSGMRRGELDSLQISSVDWEAGLVRLQAQHAKNRKAAEFPLPADYLQELFVFCAGRPLSDKLLVTVSPSKSALTLKRELVRAGIPVETPEGIIDFHSLRVTFLTLVNELGEDTKTVQTLGRHADPRLTFGKYVKQKEDRIREVITRLGNQISKPSRAIPRLGMHHTGVTSRVGEGVFLGNPSELATGKDAHVLPRDTQAIPSHGEPSRDIEKAKAATRSLFEAATKPAIPSHPETEDVSHLRHKLLAQITEALARLPADSLTALLHSLQHLQNERGVA